jgi:hypothetical protein
MYTLEFVWGTTFYHRQRYAATSYNYKSKNENKNQKKRVHPLAIYTNKLLQPWKILFGS